MHFLLLIIAFFSIACSKPSSPITWDKCSQKLLDHPCDFTLIDQNGEPWNLYAHYGTPILLDFSTEWCYWCGVAALEVAELAPKYNFIYVTIMLENRTGKPATQSLARSWANDFNLTSPVLVGNTEMNYPIEGLPSFFMIDDKMVLIGAMQGLNTSALEAMIKRTQK